jgi:hypothetical protein
MMIFFHMLTAIAQQIWDRLSVFSGGFASSVRLLLSVGTSALGRLVV